MRIAVRQREASHTLRMQRCEDLSDAAAAVIPDQVYLRDIHGIEKLLEHARIGGHRDVLIRPDLGVTMREQVQRDTAPEIRQIRELVAPKMAVQQHAVYE